jgi:hypothetical protein
MADDQRDQAGVGGTGPLYDQGEAGRKAAKEPVEIPAAAEPEKGDGNPVGEEQAAENREGEPPA